MDYFESVLKKVDQISENDEEFESFLKKVDKVSELVKDLNSSDPEAQQKADHYIANLEADEPCRTKINSTKINTNHASENFHEAQSASPEQFLKIIERNAEDRKKRRKVRRDKANVLKDKGNEAYARDDYETAVKYYSEGLAELRDMQPLYTNRAQAFIKLGRYKEAISDCEWALMCNERCIKAYLHMGKAYLALKNYKECRNCYEKIVEIEPAREKMMREYLTQAAMDEAREKQESDARVEFSKREENTLTVPLLLEKLSRSEQTPIYYCGGVELLSQAITDCTGQTLFRLNNGFSIISNNDTVRSCLLQRSKDPYANELCVSVLRLWKVVCLGNYENQKMLVTCSVSRQSVVDLLTSEDIAVQTACLALLCLYSHTPHGRGLAIDNLNLHVLLRNLKVCVSKPNKCNQTTALTILENLATEKRFRIQIRDMFSQTVGLPFIRTLRNISTANKHLLPAMISTISCLASDNVIRHNLVHCTDCWEAFLVAMNHCSGYEHNDVLYPLLGLMINVSTITSPAIQEHAFSLCSRCMALLNNSDGEIISRATGVLSNILPQSPVAVHHVVERGVVKTMCKLLKRDKVTTTKYAIKTLTVCTSISDLAREELVKSDKRLSTLRNLLVSNCDEVVCGNTALCLSHCLEVEGSATDLLGTDIVLSLLRHAAGDAKRTAVQKNASIALGKLCRAEPRHVNRLRELHGFEILHSCIKLITAPSES